MKSKSMCNGALIFRLNVEICDYGYMKVCKIVRVIKEAKLDSRFYCSYLRVAGLSERLDQLLVLSFALKES
jgi:hypothetical protein